MTGGCNDPSNCRRLPNNDIDLRSGGWFTILHRHARLRRGVSTAYTLCVYVPYVRRRGGEEGGRENPDIYIDLQCESAQAKHGADPLRSTLRRNAWFGIGSSCNPHPVASAEKAWL